MVSLNLIILAALVTVTAAKPQTPAASGQTHPQGQKQSQAGVPVPGQAASPGLTGQQQAPGAGVESAGEQAGRNQLSGQQVPSQQQAAAGTRQNVNGNSLPQGQRGRSQQGSQSAEASQTGQSQQFNRQGLRSLGSRGQQQAGQGQVKGQLQQGRGQSKGQGPQPPQPGSSDQAGGGPVNGTADASETSASAEQEQWKSRQQERGSRTEASANAGKDQAAKQEDGKVSKEMPQSDNDADDMAALNTRDKREAKKGNCKKGNCS